MSQASKAAELVSAWCKVKWPGEPNTMPSIMLEHFIGNFSGYVGGGSHKYCEADEITAHLGEPLGAGVYGYERFEDGSRIFLMCKGPLAVCDEQGCRWID